LHTYIAQLDFNTHPKTSAELDQFNTTLATFLSSEKLYMINFRDGNETYKNFLRGKFKENFITDDRVICIVKRLMD